MNQKIVLGDVLIEIKEGIGSKWAELPVLGATRAGVAPAKERPGKHPERYKPVRRGTIFYNPMRIMIGSVAFIEEDQHEGITSPDYVVFRGKEGAVDSRFFYYWLRSPLGHKCISALARGAVRERMLFNRLANAEVELPDYESQLKASEALLVCYKQIKRMRAAIEMQLDDIKSLPDRVVESFFDRSVCTE